MEFNREYFTTKNLHQKTEIRHTAVITGEIIQFIYKDFLLTKIGLYYIKRAINKQKIFANTRCFKCVRKL